MTGGRPEVLAQPCLVVFRLLLALAADTEQGRAAPAKEVRTTRERHGQRGAPARVGHRGAIRGPARANSSSKLSSAGSPNAARKGPPTKNAATTRPLELVRGELALESASGDIVWETREPPTAADALLDVAAEETVRPTDYVAAMVALMVVAMVAVGWRR